jgi:hypothetical protein
MRAQKAFFKAEVHFNELEVCCDFDRQRTMSSMFLCSGLSLFQNPMGLEKM